MELTKHDIFLFFCGSNLTFLFLCRITSLLFGFLLIMEKIFISYIFNSIMCDDDEEDDEFIAYMSSERNPCKKRKCVIGYYEWTVPRYPDFDFQAHFRLQRSTVEVLVHEVAPLITKSTGRRFFPVEKQLLLTLWYLGNQEGFRNLADRFNLTRSTAYETIHCICDGIVNLRLQYIVWPNQIEATRVANSFRQKNGFPDIIGCIDGSHIPICKPSRNPDSYLNRKGFHSLNLQGVCDDKRKFIHVSCGWPGSMHDARVFRRSDLGERLSTQPAELMYNNMHMLGDSAYPLRNYLMTPYRDNGHLNGREKKYNYCHSSIRMIIEHTFGILKTRFRILKYVNVYTTAEIPKIVLVCCILHNVCILYNDKLPDTVILEEEEQQNLVICEEFDNNGNLKRNYISSLLQ